MKKTDHKYPTEFTEDEKEHVREIDMCMYIGSGRCRNKTPECTCCKPISEECRWMKTLKVNSKNEVIYDRR